MTIFVLRKFQFLIVRLKFRSVDYLMPSEVVSIPYSTIKIANSAMLEIAFFSFNSL